MRRILLFLSLLVTCWSLRAEVKLNFTDNWDVLQAGGSWTNGYKVAHSVDFDQATVDFSGAAKQTTNITDCPVIKVATVTVTFKDGYNFTYATLNLKQWGTKKQTVKFSASTDGTNFGSEETIMTSDFKSELQHAIAAGVKAIKFSFTQDNQIGIASLVLSETDDETPKQTLEPVEINMGESFFTLTAAEGAQIKYCVNQNAEATAGECTMMYSLNEQVPFETLPGTYYVHAYAEAEGFNPSDVATASYKVKDPNATYFEIPITQDALNSTATSYISSEHEFTYEGNTYKTVSINPNSGQVKGNKSTGNFYIFNTTAIKDIDYVELYKKSGTLTASKIFIQGGDAAITENPSEGGIAGTLEGNVVTLKLTEPKDFFRVWFNDGATSGTTCIDKIVIYLKVKADYDASAFNGAAIDMTLGEGTQTLPLGETHPAMQFACDPADIVSIDATGVITALKAGTATVTAAWAEDATWAAGTATFTVNVKDETPALQTYAPAFASQSYDMVIGGETVKLPLGETHPEITFAANPEGIVVINGDMGVITAIGAGTTTVTATWAEDATWAAGTATFTVNVKDETPALQTYTPAFASQSYDMILGGEILKLPLGEEYPENIEFTWTPEDVVYIATFNGVVITALKAGTATVTATWAEDVTWAAGTATFTVNVKDETPALQTYTPAFASQSYEMTLGGEILKLPLGEEYPENIEFTWTPEDVVYIATFNGAVVTALKAGTATVTATWAEDATWAAGTATFTVNVNAPVEEVIEAKDLAEAFELGKVDDFDEDGVSVNSFKIAVPLHVFATKGNSVYATDNDIDNVGKGARIDNVPAGLDSSKQLVNVTVKYAKDGDPHFVYVSHEAGDKAAEPAYNTMSLQRVVDDMEALMHNYIKIANVYYDDATKSLNMLASVYMERAGHADATVSLNVDGTLFNGQSGYTDVEGYIERNAQDEPEFIITAIGTITSGVQTLVFDGDIQVANGQIVAPEGSEVFTVGGLRVSAKAKLPAGIYVVRTAEGAAVKVMVK